MAQNIKRIYPVLAMCFHLISNGVLAQQNQGLPSLDAPLSTDGSIPRPENQPRYAPLPCVGTMEHCAKISELAVVEKAMGNGSLASEYNTYKLGARNGSFADHMYSKMESRKSGAVFMSVFGGASIIGGTLMMVSTPLHFSEEVFLASFPIMGVGIVMAVIGGKVRRRTNIKLRALDEIRFRERHNLPLVEFLGVSPYAGPDGGGIAAGIAY